MSLLIQENTILFDPNIKHDSTDYHANSVGYTLDSLRAICWQFIVQRDLDSAKIYADSIAHLSEDLKSEEGRFLAEFYLGVIGRHNASYHKALRHLKNYLDYFESQRDSARIVSGLFQISAINFKMGNFEESLRGYLKILTLTHHSGDMHMHASALNSTGVVYKSLGNFNEALLSYNKSLKIFHSLDAKIEQADVLVNMANLFILQDRPNLAKEHLTQALEIDRSIGNKFGVSVDLESLGNVFLAQGLLDQSLSYHKKSLNIKKEMQNKESLAHSLAQIGKIYLLKNNYDQAEIYLMDAYQLAKKIHAKPLIAKVAIEISELYELSNNYELAYQFQKQHHILKDSLLNETTMDRLNELKTRYEIEKKDQQIQLMVENKKLQARELHRETTLKLVFITVACLLSVLVFLLWHIYAQKLKNQKLLNHQDQAIKSESFQRQLSELKMKALQAQINPHFLFNCLNSINSLILNQEIENASYYLSKFSKLIRKILEHSRETFINAEEEVNFLQSYIYLEELRLKRRICFEIVTDQHIDLSSIYLPSMILQPLVENAIWHGLLHKDIPEEGQIKLEITQKTNQIFFIIEDNGVGRKKASSLTSRVSLKPQSLGLKITKDRLDLLENGQALPISTEDVVDEKMTITGTRVTVCIPDMQSPT